MTMNPKPHAKLTATLRILLKISIGVTAVAVLAGFYGIYSYATLPSNVDANEIMLPSDHVLDIVTLVQIILGIITGITILWWTYRSNKNLRALSGESMRFTPVWSIAWDFIPIANLWKPYQVMKEIWQVSHKGASTTHSVVKWWWALWLISAYLTGGVFLKEIDYSSASSYAASAMTFIISDVFDVIFYVVTLVMVTRIGAAYSRNIVEQDGGGKDEQRGSSLRSG
jgi:hypothetical protein